MPTLDNLRYDVHPDSTHFGQGDISSAFESMWLMAGQGHLLTVVPPVQLGPEDFTVEELEEYGMSAGEIEQLMQEDEWLLQWVGVPQGLAPAAPFWQVHLVDGLNHLFKEEWRQWFLLYVDDALPHGAGREQAEARQRIFEVAMEVLGKQLSDKVEDEIKEQGFIAGLKFEAGGVVIDDDAVEAVVAALDEVMEKKRVKEKDARRLMGILIYSSSAFEWDVSDQTWWSRMVEPITDTYKGAQFEWTAEAARNVQAMRERVRAVPRRTCMPAMMVDNGWRLVIKSDGCDEGVGACLLLVKCDEDGSVTPEMMLDQGRVRLLATDSKVLSEAERKWLTFEVECYGMYRALRKWSGLLMQVSHGGQKWAPLLWMDSTTATSKWMGISVPSHVDHANAKELRFLSWAEKIAYVQWMGLDMRWIPGSANDFADLLSRMAAKIGEAARAQAVVRMVPMNIATKEGVPSGYEAVNLALTEDAWKEVKKAYMEDQTSMQSVTVEQLYRCVCMEAQGVDSETAMKIRPWVGRRYFSVQPPGSEDPMVYVPSTQLRQHWQGDETRRLVLLVPKGARARVTEAAAVVDEGQEEHYEMLDLRRDLLLHCHDNDGHPQLGEFIAAVKSMAYWGTLAGAAETQGSAAAHLAACAHCLAKQRMMQEHGVGIDSQQRARVLQLDHLVLTDEEAALAGCLGSLQIIDVATRVGVFCAAESQSAE